MRNSKGQFVKGSPSENPAGLLLGHGWNKGKKGSIPWNKNLKGIHLSPITEFKKGQTADEKNAAWKGDNVGYVALHKWVARKRGKPQQCEHCKTTKAKQFDWANKSGKYLRNLNDWLRLCVSCHHKYDNTNLKKGQYHPHKQNCLCFRCKNIML